MKNLVLLRTPAEVTAHVRGLLRTSELRESAYVAAWIARFAAHPAVFAEFSDGELEYPHFATWFGMTYVRSYDDPVISDLYYLHEIVHAVLLLYGEAPLFTAWYRKMNGVELSASLETEGYVYLEVPGLRERSFRDEIWADRYLGAERRLGRALRDIMRQDRYRAMSHPDPMDYCEQQIAAYARQNFEWANIWKLDAGGHDGGGPHASRRPAYLVVEEHMARFRASAIGLDEHVAWLRQFGEIPFPVQARLFAPVYWNSKLSYRL
jgi:hypothetical protein